MQFPPMNFKFIYLRFRWMNLNFFAVSNLKFCNSYTTVLFFFNFLALSLSVILSLTTGSTCQNNNKMALLL